VNADATRPYPPGDYPVVVVGSGPGALQTTYDLRRLGIEHAVISADEAPGGMFRRWPFFQRLLSWTKPYAPSRRGSRAYERYDWNSLLGVEPELRAIQAELMDGTSYFPSRPEMEQNLVTFAELAALRIRYGCRWTATRREATADGDRFVLETTDGEYRCQVAIFAVGVAEPYTPRTPGIELARHYAETRDADSYAGRRVFIIGKQNSGFELASGLLPWARRIVLASPSPARLSVETRSLVGVRARYVQPFEDHILGGGVSILDAAIEAIEPAGEALLVRARRTDGAGSLAIEVDDVIAATGFTCPLNDLEGLGVATFGNSRLPAQTAYWESATVPGIYFAGTIGQGSPGLKKHGIPANSGAVQGARYNARVLVQRIARTRFGIEPERPVIPAAELVEWALTELCVAPELWHQKAFLARIAEVDPARGIVDAGVEPLAAWLDREGDGVALTLEADGSATIYPVIYVRQAGKVSELAVEPDPLLDYTGEVARRQVAEIIRPVSGGAG
jgi:thioredoxin reductase